MLATRRTITQSALFFGVVLAGICGLADQPGERKEAAPKPVLKPEDWSGEFARRLNAGDLDGVVALYDPDARFVPPEGGETLVGRDRIRPVLAGLIAAKAQFRSKVVRVNAVDDVAILYSDFEGTTVDESGKRTALRSKAIEVLRRHPEDGWRLIVGDPHGRGR